MCGGKNTELYSNEVYVDSYATNSYGLWVKDDTVGHHNRVFGSGFHPIGLMLGYVNARNRKYHSNYIQMQAVPRADIVAVDDSVSIEELLRVFRTEEHSRLPIYHETLDDPRGMIHIRDLMSWITEEANGGEGEKLDLSKVDLSRSAASIRITRELIYVPASMSVLDLLLRMQTLQLHLALVVDEYGGTDGLVSIEDLVEEVVGDIADEHDVEDEPMIRKDPRLGLIADARIPIEEMEEHLGVELVPDEQEEDIDTLGGVVFSLTGRVPARGELVPHPSGIEFEVLEADPRRIKKLRIHVPKEPEPAAETGEPGPGPATY